MNNFKKTLLILAVAVSTIVSTKAMADCEQRYDVAIKEAPTSAPIGLGLLFAVVFAVTNSRGSGFQAFLAYASLPAGIGASIAMHSNNKSMALVQELIREAKVGAGLSSNNAAAELNAPVSEVAKTIVELNNQDAFCPGEAAMDWDAAMSLIRTTMNKPVIKTNMN